ncbi:FK506-binding protein 5-like isoform X2 [Lytechinus pictus]|uniref:FK506-binding protein 5-like isoform X2 n=1 Tax=Lytechinus pictus TaxID=7653 RepID=UPI0030B9D97E
MPVTHIHSSLQKSFTSIGVKESQNVTADMKRLKTDNPGDVDLDLIKSSKLLSSSAAKHRISVAPSNRRPSKKARARTPQKRSSSRLDDAPSPIAEEPSTPTKSPAPIDLDSELPFPGVALSTSPAQQHSNGSTSKPKGLGPMVLPALPPFGPKGSRGREIESTPISDSLSRNSDLPSDSAIFPPQKAESVSDRSKIDALENQKNGQDIGTEKGRHDDIEKLLDVDPSLFGDDAKVKEDGSTTNKVGGVEDNGEVPFKLGGDGLMDAGSVEEQGHGGVGEGLGIADLDLLVDLPDPLDLGKNMFGVETIMEEDEEVETGEEMEGSDDFLEDESSAEEFEVEEEAKERVKVGTVAAMISSVEEEIRKSPPEKGKGKVMVVGRKEEKKEEMQDAIKMEEGLDVGKKDELCSSVKEDKSESPSSHGVKRVVDDHVAMETDTTNNKDDDNDINDSNYPGIGGRLSPEDSVMGSVKLTREDKEEGDAPKNDGVPIVIIESPSSDDLKTSLDATLEGNSQEEVEEEPMILPQVPKEVIIIMKDDPAKKEDAGTKKEPEKEAKPSTPTTPEPPVTPVETTPPEEDAAAASQPPPQMKKKEEVEKESTETEKDVEEVKKEEVPDDAEERRLSVAASKALFEAKIPAASEPTKSSNKVVVNGYGAQKTDVRRTSQPSETIPETKAEADTKLSEKEEKKAEKEEEKEEKDDGKEEHDQVFANKEEAEEAKEEPVSLKDRISRFQNLATKTSVKGLTAHVPTRSSPSKQRPASTSNIENKESPKKLAPKVPSKPSSTSSNKLKGSTAPTTGPSRLSTNPSSSSRPPLQPMIDCCMVCEKSAYPNEMSKFEGRVFHRTCQKCSECSRTLTLWNLDIADDRLFCKQHGTVVKNKQLKEKLII